MNILVFEIGGRSYALPADAVRQVDLPLPVTPLPFVPDYVEGVTAIGGRVLPQVDLAARLGVPKGDGAGELVVVATAGRECVVRIGHARRMMDLSDGDLVALGEAEGGDAPAMIAGEFLVDGTPVLLIRAEALGLEGVPQAAPASAHSGALLGDADIPSAAGRGAAVDGMACLVVRIGGERYAFPLESVAEVYEDAALTPVPNAPDVVAGISVLRGRPRLVVSLARLLGLDGGGNPAQMVAAVSRGMPLVFQCDALLGIRRFADGRREGAGDKTGCVDSYLIGEDGSVTGLLGLDGLVPAEQADRLRGCLPRDGNGAAGAGAAGREETRRMLLVRAGREICGLDIERIERVVAYAAPTGLPSPKGLLIGMTDIAGRVLPVADLGAVFGSPIGGDAQAYVVVRTARADGYGTWALAVEALERLTDIPVSSIRRAAGTPGGVVSGVGRVGDRLVSLLDVDELEMDSRDGRAELVA